MTQFSQKATLVVGLGFGLDPISQLILLLLIWPSVQNLSIDTVCLLKSRKSCLMLYLPMAKDPGQAMVRGRKGCFFVLCLSGHFTWIEILSLTMVLCQSPWPYHTLHSHHALENISIPLSPFTHLLFTAAAWIFLLETQRSKTDLGTEIRDSYHWGVSGWHMDDAGKRDLSWGEREIFYPIAMVSLQVRKLPSPFPFSSLRHYLSKSKLCGPSIQLSENHQGSICPTKQGNKLDKRESAIFLGYLFAFCFSSSELSLLFFVPGAWMYI